MTKWIVVPLQPTKNMLEAGFAPNGLTMDGYPNPHTLEDKYISMIHARPETGLHPEWTGELQQLWNWIINFDFASIDEAEGAYLTIRKLYQILGIDWPHDQKRQIDFSQIIIK